jgi:UDP-N-acetylmuramoyl-tripeptide--D-alanyl-D-alanine ligase
VKRWTPEAIARAAGVRLVRDGQRAGGPERAIIDSRQAGAGALFVGLPGERVDGGTFAAQALAAGAWGVLVASEHAENLASGGPGAVLVAADPLAALQQLAAAWRVELGAEVIGVTGSTGKTSTKDLLLAVLAPHRRTVASRANYNTEIGLPLEILAAPADTEVLVLEMAMRGPGQIAELAAIARPDVGVIVTIGPVHLELLGSLEAVAAAKAELIAALAPGATAIIPAGEPLLAPHVREDLRTLRFGADGDVRFAAESGAQVDIDCAGERVTLEVPFTQRHLRTNLLAVVAAALAVGVRPCGRVELALSSGRGQPVELERGVLLIDDSYNANPLSVRAALEYLSALASENGGRRRVAVLGDMLELGPDELRFHAEIGALAAELGVEVLVAVGPLAAEIAAAGRGERHTVADAATAAELVPGLIAPGDVVLVKGSRGVALELVCQAILDSASPSATGRV